MLQPFQLYIENCKERLVICFCYHFCDISFIVLYISYITVSVFMAGFVSFAHGEVGLMVGAQFF